MRIIVLLILTVISLNSYGQLLEMPLSKSLLKKDVPFPPPINKDGTFKFDKQLIEKEAKIQAWPNEKIQFNIRVNSLGHKIYICDTLGNILYSQKKREGSFNCKTFSSYRYFVIYDLDKFKHKNFVGYNPVDDFHRTIVFGEDRKADGIIDIIAKKIN